HARIAAAIEGRYADRLAEQVERLAHHTVRGEVWDKATDYLCDAVGKAVERSAYREAAAYYEHALGALGQLPRRPATLERAVDIRIALRDVLYPLVELDASAGYLEEARAIAESLGDQHRLGWVSVYLSADAWRRG